MKEIVQQAAAVFYKIRALSSKHKKRTFAAFTVAIALLFCLYLRFSPYPALQAFRTRQISTCILDRAGRVVQITSIGNINSSTLHNDSTAAGNSAVSNDTSSTLYNDSTASNGNNAVLHNSNNSATNTSTATNNSTLTNNNSATSKNTASTYNSNAAGGTPLPTGLRREWVSLDDMPPHLADIFIAAEDRHFRYHLGIDIAAIARALYLDATRQRVVSGASTITMQLARMISYNVPNVKRGRTVLRKIKECIDALRLEARLNKDEILELYLNNVPFGFNTEGVASAARTFFAVPISRLTLEECLLLAVIPRRPAMYNPLYHKAECAHAASLLLKSIQIDNKHSSPDTKGYANGITEDTLLSAVSSAHSYKYPFNMPHYIRYLQGKGAAMLYGASIGRTPIIRLSADLSLQHTAEHSLSDAISNTSRSRITQGALLAFDTKTGEVLSWVGSRNFSATSTGQVDGVLALEQPGSAMKPFLYALSLDKYGYSPSSVLPDVPLEAGGEKVYVPQNFNNRLSGPVRLRIALASSLNIPAVYLLRSIGISPYKECLHALHFTSLEGRNDLGLSLALGAAEVSLLEMTRAFSVFPRDGVHIPLVAVQKGAQGIPAVNKINAPPYSRTSRLASDGETVYTPDTARLICSILSDPSARAMGFGYASVFNTSFPSMFKTGTANQYTSIVAFAATPLYTVGVWMGNFDGNTVRGVTGSALPARVAREVLEALHEGEKAVPFSLPAAWEVQRICSLSGMASTPLCPNTVEEFVREASPPSPCTWHTKSGLQYPVEYASYMSIRQRAAQLQDGGNLIILTPQDDSLFFIDTSVPYNQQYIKIQAAGGSGKWEAALDGSPLFPLLDTSYPSPQQEVTFEVPLTRGRHACTIYRGNEHRTVTWQVK